MGYNYESHVATHLNVLLTALLFSESLNIYSAENFPRKTIGNSMKCASSEGMCRSDINNTTHNKVHGYETADRQVCRLTFGSL